MFQEAGGMTVYLGGVEERKEQSMPTTKTKPDEKQQSINVITHAHHWFTPLGGFVNTFHPSSNRAILLLPDRNSFVLMTCC